MEKEIWDDIIIGAGYAGLSLAALLVNQSRKVLILESHSLVGGCAGYFKRSDFHFDVGATTLSGLSDKMPLNQLINKLNLKNEYKKLDIAMKIKLANGVCLNRYADIELWIDELNQKFPNIDHRTFWEKLERISNRAWTLLADAWSFPPQSLADFFNLLNPKLIKQVDLGLYLLQPLKNILPKEYEDGVLRSFIDEQLLISTQTTSHDVPILMGALGLTYPSDMYYPIGGISTLALSLAEYISNNGGRLLLKSKVQSISDDLEVSTQNKKFKAKRVISTLPIWNLKSLNPKLSQWSHSQACSKGEYWSAITANLAVKFKTPKTQLYHQIHLKEPLSAAKSNSLFISLSDPSDNSRAPRGWQTTTISTHALPSDFPSERNAQYKEMKSQILTEIMQYLNKYFDDIEDTKFESVGTPLTFVKYTNRYLGRVGGIPHSVNFMPWKWPKNVTPLTNFFHHGDTSFPGQGIVGVVQGSLNFMKRYHGEK